MAEKGESKEEGITDEYLAERKSMVGTKFDIQDKRNELACKETMVNFACGVGDDNPLYNDEEYAKKTRYGCLVAPPSWLYSTIPMIEQPEVDPSGTAIRLLASGDNWEFYKPVLIGDRIRSDQILAGCEDKVTKTAGRAIFEYHNKLCYNQRDELVAKSSSLLIRIGASKEAGEKKNASPIQLPHPWTEEELEKIEAEIMAEEVRGDKTRYWEDVQVGEELPQIVKGPVGISDEICFFAACGSYNFRAHKVLLAKCQEEPSRFFRDPYTHALESTCIGMRTSKYAAQAYGQPLPFAWGRQTISWAINLLTNWMSDEGWLKKCFADVRGFIYLSEVVWLKGKVTNKYIDENNEYCVDIET
ncbi:MaoC family dehydratase N-terminal domain-containing protein, partial [Chloroflexota bacterium]